MAGNSQPDARVGAPSGVTALLRQPAVPVLMTAWLAMVRREYLPDITLYSGALALIAVDQRRWSVETATAEPSGEDRHRPRVVALAALGAALFTALPRRSIEIDAAFAVVGALALSLAWLPGAPPRPSGTPDPDPPSWWVWPTLAVAMGLVAGFSFLHQLAPMVDSPQHPSVSSLVEPALDPWPVRFGALWLWFAAGWWLLRRIRSWPT